MADKEPTQKEVEEQKKKMREIALKNLATSNLMDLSVAYYTDREDSGYGKIDKDSVEKSLYYPAMSSGTEVYEPESGEKTDLLRNSLLNSRQDGKRYSGQVSEHEIIKTATTIMQQSLGAVKVDDIMNLIGSNIDISKNYKDKYLADLAKSENKEEQETVQKLMGGYISYLTSQGVSKALGQRTENIKGGLEELVKE